MSKRIPKNLLQAWEFNKKYQQLEEQLKQQQQQQQQRSIKNLPRHIKNKKCYFITEVNENENDYKSDDYENDDDNYDDEDDEVEYIKVKKKRIKKTFNHQKKAKKVQNGIIDYINN